MASPSPISGLSRGFSAYVEELHEFFKIHHMPFGSPEDIVPFAENLSTPDTFQDEMASMMRSIVLREGGNVPRAELLQLVSTAVGGPHFEKSAQEHLQPVLKILSFLADVHRSRWGLVPELEEPAAAQRASGSPAPAAAPACIEPAVLAGAATVGSAIPISPIAARADSMREAAAPAHSAREMYSRSPATYPEGERPDAIGNLRAFPAAMATARFAEPEDLAGEKVVPQPWMRRRAVWAVAACAVLLVMIGSIVLHRRSTEQREWVMQHVRPVSAAVSAGVLKPAKPTADGASVRSAIAARSAKIAGAAGRTLGPAPYYRGGQLNRGGRLNAGDGVSVASANQSAMDGQQSWATEGSLPAAPQAPIYRVDPATGGGSYISPVEPVSSAAAESAPVVPRTRHVNGLVSTTFLPSAGRSFSGRPLSVSSGVMAGNVISAPAPEYPAVAKLVHIQGQVILQAVVSRNGNVVATHVLRGHRLLRGAAKDAVSRWRFRPYIFNGKPTDVATIVTVDFRRSH